MTYLKGLTALEELHLSSTSVSDAGLAHLKELTELRSLDLGQTHITDAGLVHLRGLPSLRYLDIWYVGPDGKGIRESEPGVVELRRALPDCDIVGFRPSPEVERALKMEEIAFTVLFLVFLIPFLMLLLYLLAKLIKRLIGRFIKCSP